MEKSRSYGYSYIYSNGGRMRLSACDLLRRCDTSPMAAAQWQLQIWQTLAVLVAELFMNWLSLRQVQRCGYFQT